MEVNCLLSGDQDEDIQWVFWRTSEEVLGTQSHTDRKIQGFIDKDKQTDKRILDKTKPHTHTHTPKLIDDRKMDRKNLEMST